MSVRVVCSVAAGLWAGLAAGPAAADFVVLKSGSEIHGELLAESGAPAGDAVSIRTVSGAVLVIAKSEVRSTTRRRVVLEEYDARLNATPATVDGLWQLAEWCRAKGLREQRETQLQRLLELDPEHLASRRGLGQIRYEGRWTTRDDMMAARGYVKFKGKYVLPQELDLIRQDQKETEAERAWYRRVNMWRSWLNDARDERGSEATRQLQAIDDPHAVAALYKAFRDHELEPVRLMYVGILGKIRGDKALGSLVFQSLQDASELVRAAAVRALPRDGRAKAVPVYIRMLRNPTNALVNRAAFALGEIGDSQATPRLIDALTTHHEYTVLVPNPAGAMGFTPGGGMVPTSGPLLPPDISLMLATGQLPMGVQVNVVDSGVTSMPLEERVEREEENPEVLHALQKLTGADFGYDKSEWRAWLNAKRNGALNKKATP